MLGATTRHSAISLGVPTETDMLAAFGLDPQVEDDASLTYVFRSPASETDLLVNYSQHRPLLAVSMTVSGKEAFSIETDGVASIRIVSERGACWLQVAFEDGRGHPDMFIHLEPTPKLRW